MLRPSFLNRRPLTREIVLILAAKLVALAGLWFFFVRDHRLPQDPLSMTRHFLEER